MDLFSLRLAGFRRFDKQSDLRTNGKLVALIGRNEVGKSTILQALTLLTDDTPIADSDVTRGADPNRVCIEARYLLSAHELEEARLTGPRWFLVQKKVDGVLRYGFEPKAPDRDITNRDLLYRDLVSVFNDNSYREQINSEYPDLVENVIVDMTKIVGDSSDLSSEVRKSLKSHKDHLAAAFDLSKHSGIRNIIESWDLLLKEENEPNPWSFAVSKIKKLVPKILIFNEQDRGLLSTYQITSIREDVPIALRNICEVADLNVDDLFKIVDSENTPTLTTLEHRANRALASKFAETWRQSGISVALRLSVSNIEVQIVNEGREFSALAERSDGLRQFVALQSFALRHKTESPILLIDEAEQHLHYDAQADLIQMLSRQCISPKIIYTTHSAGCLPEDLGNGVRLVAEESADPTRSQIVNKFWAQGSDGFTPLLIGLGATTLAFFPTRRAVMVEGPADMLLYPPMFREALQIENLGFQFVPGLASSGIALAKESLHADNQVLFLVDGDDSGDIIAKKLAEIGVKVARILQLRNPGHSAVEIEDFIGLDLLVAAANALISRFHVGSTQISVSEIKPMRRMSQLEATYFDRTGTNIPKIELAYEVLDLLDRTLHLNLLDTRRKAAFANVALQVVSIFKL